jgi:hypothetical protein
MLLQEKSSNSMSGKLPSEFLHLRSLGVCLAPAVLQKMGTGCRGGGTRGAELLPIAAIRPIIVNNFMVCS